MTNKNSERPWFTINVEGVLVTFDIISTNMEDGVAHIKYFEYWDEQHDHAKIKDFDKKRARALNNYLRKNIGG